jgi:hypothetical protein
VTLVLFLRLVGASLLVLSLFHAVLWRALDWGSEIERLSPLNARVFAVHTFFIAFVLFGLGALSLTKPELLLSPGDLPRLILCSVVVFWIARLAAQPLIFDRVMRDKWTRSLFIRIGASLLWAAYAAVYSAALFRQWGSR